MSGEGGGKHRNHEGLEGVRSACEGAPLTVRATVRPILACLFLVLPACGGSGGSGGDSETVITGTAVVVNEGSPFKVDIDADFRSDGMVHAELTWAVVTPGSGSSGSQAPHLTLVLLRECVDFECPPEGGSAGPAAQGPLVITVSVHTASHYLVQVRSNSSCGGCQIEYRLTASHPKGSLKLRPHSTCSVFLTTINSCQCTGITNPVIDLQASPPRARLRQGEKASIKVQGAGCAAGAYFDVEGWSFSDPTVASIEPLPFRDPNLVALEPGLTRVVANVIQIDGSRLPAELAYCSGSPAICTTLVLDVSR